MQSVRTCTRRPSTWPSESSGSTDQVAAIIIAGGVAFTPGQYIHVMALLGVGGAAAVAFWNRMLRASKGKEPPEFASDHPSDQHRIERIEGWLPEAEHSYTPAPSN